MIGPTAVSVEGGCRVPRRNSRFTEIAALLRARILAANGLPVARCRCWTPWPLSTARTRTRYGPSAKCSSRRAWSGRCPAGDDRPARNGAAAPDARQPGQAERRHRRPGYSFPSASGQEVWRHHITPTAKPERLDDPRIARLLKVPAGSEVLLRHRVTGPEAEPPFQVNNSWVHPRVAGIPGVAGQATGPGDWLYRIEQAGHGPLSWMEYHRARLPTTREASRAADSRHHAGHGDRPRRPVRA